MRILGLVLAGGKGDRLEALTAKRTIAAMPVGGKFRAVDFVLSNMVNSGIETVGIITQFNPRSLADHLGSGKEWGLDRKEGGLFILQPYITDTHKSWYRGTVDAIYQNLTILKRSNTSHALIASGEHIYRMNYESLFKYHKEKNANITIMCKKVNDKARLRRFGVIEIDDNKRIIGFEEKPRSPRTDLASMGVYFIEKDLLISLLSDAISMNGYDLVRNILLPYISDLKIYAYEFKGFWESINTVKSYYNVNMEMLNPRVRHELLGDGGIYTKSKDLAPVKFVGEPMAENSIIAEGSIIAGKVKNSAIFRSVDIKAGAYVENSIVMEGSRIEKRAKVVNAIIDKNCIITERSTLHGTEYKPVIVGKSTVVT